MQVAQRAHAEFDIAGAPKVHVRRLQLRCQNGIALSLQLRHTQARAQPPENAQGPTGHRAGQHGVVELLGHQQVGAREGWSFEVARQHAHYPCRVSIHRNHAVHHIGPPGEARLP